MWISTLTATDRPYSIKRYKSEDYVSVAIGRSTAQKINWTYRMLKILQRRYAMDILQVVCANPGICVGDIVTSVRTPYQSDVSTRLKDLRQFGLVTSKRSGKKVWYYPNWGRIRKLEYFINAIQQKPSINESV